MFMNVVCTKKVRYQAARGPSDVHERRGDVHERIDLLSDVHERHKTFINGPVHERQTSYTPSTNSPRLANQTCPKVDVSFHECAEGS